MHQTCSQVLKVQVEVHVLTFRVQVLILQIQAQLLNLWVEVQLNPDHVDKCIHTQKVQLQQYLH